jgi:hypothetical protein
MAIYVRCRSCGDDHEFPVVVSRRTFETLAHDFRSAWTRSWFRCPRIGSVSTVNNADLYWKE